MTFQIIKGDLFDPSHEFEALAQGVNTFGVMGAGIAVPFREKYPEMFESYRDLCSRHGQTLAGLAHIYHPLPELSTIEQNDQGATIFHIPDTDPIIYNLFSQIAPGKNADYSLLQTAAILMRQDAENNLLDKVGMPWIGCGIGGLEKHNVQAILSTVLATSDTEFFLVEQ
jgi:O-acetyl-ADP-ribose deacetylase (regulator of RNase III)